MLIRMASAAVLLTLSRCLLAAPVVALPTDVVLANHAQSLIVNGVSVATYALRSVRSPAELGAIIDRFWRKGDASLPIVHQQAGEWLVVSRRDGGCIHTVQWRADVSGGSSGYYSAMNIEARPARGLLPLLPMPASVRIRSYVQSHEADAVRTQFIATIPMSTGPLVELLRRTALGQRWVVGPRGPTGQEAVLALQRGAAELDLIVTPGSIGSTLVINQRESASPGR
jgi:hypothetical protein